MRISELAIQRPIFATMVVSALVVFGAIAYRTIGVSLFPEERLTRNRLEWEPIRRLEQQQRSSLVHSRDGATPRAYAVYLNHGHTDGVSTQHG